MSLTDEMFRLVNDAVADHPLAVERTSNGFDLRADVVDAKWRGLLHDAGVEKVFTHHVAVDEPQRTYTITDDSYELEWKSGVEVGGGVPMPTLRRSVERTLGTRKEFKLERRYAVTADLQLEKVVDYRFSSEVGRNIIRDAADRVGLDERTNRFTKIGIVAAAVGALAAIGAVVLVVML